MGMAWHVPARNRAAGDGLVFAARTARDGPLHRARAGADDGGPGASRLLDVDSQLPDSACRAVPFAPAADGRAMELDWLDRRPDGYLLQPLRQTRSSLEIPPGGRGDNFSLRDGHDRQHAERIFDGPAGTKIHHQLLLPDVGGRDVRALHPRYLRLNPGGG